MGTSKLATLDKPIRPPVGWRSGVTRAANRHTLLLLFLPAFLTLFLTTVGPFLWALWLSFTNFTLSRPGAERFVGFQTYAYVLGQASLRNAVSNTYYMVGAAVAAETVLGLVLALLLARTFRGVRVARSLFLIPLMTTPVVVALTWRMLLSARFGHINYFLGLLGLPQPDWLGDPALAMPALILADVWVATPFMGSILLAGLLSLPEESFEAAEVEGASPLQKLWYVTLPLLRPIIALAVMFRAVDAFGKFESILIMTAGGPGEVTTTLNYLAYTTGFLFQRLADSAAMSVIMVVLMLVIVVVCIKWSESAGT